jgi:hypothetical protein
MKVVDVCFTPKATHLLCGNEMTRHSCFISVESTGLDRSCGALTAAALAIIMLAVVATT